MGFTAAIVAATVAGGVIASQQKIPKLPDPAPPAPPPQAAKSPTVADTRTGLVGAGQSGGSPGTAQTLLSGIGGVDSSQLKLGRNTLLGG